MRDLGVLFDSELTMKKHYCQGRSNVLLPHSPTPPDPPSCRQRRHRPPCVAFDNAAVGLLQLGVRGPAAAVSQAVTESAERRCSACVWPTSSWSCLAYLMQLHWLPVRSRVQFKLCTLMHAIHNQRSRSYLSDTVQTVATATIRCGLRSSATTDYVMPRTLSKFGVRAFAYAKTCCLEPPYRSNSSPVYTFNLQKTFENVFIRWSF